jgi:iron complex outermembrane recepter protein
MEKHFSIQVIVALMLLILFSLNTQAQLTKISGKVTNESKEPLTGANILVKDRVSGTTSNHKGKFYLEVKGAPPVILSVSMIGYKSQEIEVSENKINLEIILVKSINMLDEILVQSPSRVEENILQSPVSIEKMSMLEIKNIPAFDYYAGIATMKGVDMISSSIGFQVVNTRGFASTLNTRFIQLFDGMDVQSPSLNLLLGNANGPMSLDVESIELIPGTASALYGPNAFNGVLITTSKSPFKYQGLSATVKLGMNHFGSEPDVGEPSNPQPMYEAAVRYAKAFNNKFAFKIAFSWMQARDWSAHNYTDKNTNLQGNLNINPAYDGVNLYGDDGGINLGLLRSSSDLINALAYQTVLYPETVAPYVGALPAQNVNRTGYPEYKLIDCNSKNLKANIGLNYRINDNIELDYGYNISSGTSVLTGTQRYSIVDANNQIHRLGIKADNWNLLGYGVFESNGDSYIADFTGYAINNAYLSNPAWFGTYAGTFAGGLLAANMTETGSPVYDPDFIDALLNNPDAVSDLHIFSRDAADAGRWEPGCAAFQNAFDSINAILIPDGAQFYNHTRFYHAEGQCDFRNEINIFDMTMGANWRQYDLRSDGTIYPDSEDNPIRINEYGAYIQISKKLINDHLKLTFSGRYDKSKNFSGQFSPRISGVYTVLKDHNFRASYQTGFRNPTTQGQYLDLDVISTRIIGGLQEFYDEYKISDWSYTIQSVNSFTNSVVDGSPDPGLLVPYTTWSPIKPEHVQVFEVGYKGLFAEKLMIDAYYYFNIYNDFIEMIRVRQAQDDSGNPTDPFSDPTQAALFSLLSGDADNTFQIYQNNSETVKSQGAAFGLDYIFYKSYRAGMNYSWNKLIVKGLSDEFLNEYNTPEHIVNVTFGNRKLTENFGFNITWRWQNAFTWNSTFVQNG